MTATARIVGALKQILRGKRITYADVARRSSLGKAEREADVLARADERRR